jgi:cytochrome c oxidase assembly factor CtaG
MGRTAAHDTRSARPERNAVDVRRAWDDAAVKIGSGAVRSFVGAAAAGLLLAGPAAAPALAHGPVPADPPTVLNLAFGWSFEPVLVLPLIITAWLWTLAVRRVNAAHPDNPVPRRRSVFFLGGLLTIAIALQSGIERYDTTLFSIHMVQHVLLTLVAAPLIALGAPVTLLLRVATPAGRKRWILPVLHSRVLRVLSFPVVAWVALAAVMWGTHFSALFDIALENRSVHDLEHVLYLAAGLLFWWPAVGLDPSPWRMNHPVRALYVFLQMPQNTLLAVIILNAAAPLYQHYATLVRPWGPTALLDQQYAAGIMWLSGDLLFIAAMAAIMAGWMRHEERQTARAERVADDEMASIRVREARLAKRLEEEREGR